MTATVSNASDTNVRASIFTDFLLYLNLRFNVTRGLYLRKDFLSPAFFRGFLLNAHSLSANQSLRKRRLYNPHALIRNQA